MGVGCDPSAPAGASVSAPFPTGTYPSSAAPAAACAPVLPSCSGSLARLDTRFLLVDVAPVECRAGARTSILRCASVKSRRCRLLGPKWGWDRYLGTVLVFEASKA